MKVFYCLPFAALAIGLALTQCAPRSILIDGPAVVSLAYLEGGTTHILDADLSPLECRDAAHGVAGLECRLVDRMPSRLPDGATLSEVLALPVYRTPLRACELLLAAAIAGAVDGYARAESNCGPIY